VVAVKLATSCDDLEVLELESAERPAELVPSAGRRHFVVRSRNMEGFVIAGAVFHIEGGQTHSDQSPLMPKFPP